MYGGGGAAAAVEEERTAFRKAEKRYKLYKASSSRRPTKHQGDPIRPTDLSDVVDFHAILDLHRRGEDLPSSIEPHRGFTGPPVFRLRDRPGFYFIPGALSIEEQCQWVRESLMNFPQPPNRTNHTAMYGHMHDLFLAAQKQKVLVEVGSEYVFAEDGAGACDRGSFRPVPAGVLLRKLRWSTLGLQFDWSKRNYDVSLPHNKIPDALCYLTKKMAAPAMSQGEEFHPEAAIVNYFGPSDMLGGHLDDMEADWSKPIVSISLGCKAIFLLGGKSREDVPIAMFLRSGDVVLMAGQARECFHGVPRIFTDEENAGSSALISQFSGEDDQAFADYLRNSRININIRQVN